MSLPRFLALWSELTTRETVKSATVKKTNFVTLTVTLFVILELKKGDPDHSEVASRNYFSAFQNFDHNGSTNHRRHAIDSFPLLVNSRHDDQRSDALIISILGRARATRRDPFSR